MFHRLYGQSVEMLYGLKSWQKLVGAPVVTTVGLCSLGLAQRPCLLAASARRSSILNKQNNCSVRKKHLPAHVSKIKQLFSLLIGYTDNAFSIFQNIFFCNLRQYVPKMYRLLFAITQFFCKVISAPKMLETSLQNLTKH